MDAIIDGRAGQVDSERWVELEDMLIFIGDQLDAIDQAAVAAGAVIVGDGEVELKSYSKTIREALPNYSEEIIKNLPVFIDRSMKERTQIAAEFAQLDAVIDNYSRSVRAHMQMRLMR